MNETLKTLLIAGALLITLCLGWFFFLYQPKSSRLETVKEETQGIVFKLQSMRVTEAQVVALEKQVKIIKNDIKLTQDKIIFKDDLPAAIREIKTNGSKFGLKFHKIIPEDEWDCWSIGWMDRWIPGLVAPSRLPSFIFHSLPRLLTFFIFHFVFFTCGFAASGFTFYCKFKSPVFSNSLGL